MIFQHINGILDTQGASHRVGKSLGGKVECRSPIKSEGVKERNFRSFLCSQGHKSCIVRVAQEGYIRDRLGSKFEIQSQGCADVGTVHELSPNSRVR